MAAAPDVTVVTAPAALVALALLVGPDTVAVPAAEAAPVGATLLALGRTAGAVMGTGKMAPTKWTWGGNARGASRPHAEAVNTRGTCRRNGCAVPRASRDVDHESVSR